MDLVHTLFDVFINSNDPKIIIEKASEINTHFKSVMNKEPNDEIGEELFYLLGAKKDSFEWLLFLTILSIEDDNLGEYLKRIENYEINIKQCEWALLILEEIRTIAHEGFIENISEIIVHLDNVKNENLKKKTEKIKNVESAENRKGFWGKLLSKRQKLKNLYLKGTTKIELLAILIQSYSDSPHELIDNDTANDIIRQVIPNIEQCVGARILIKQADDYKDTIKNSVSLSKEYKNSEGTFITGLISAHQNNVPIVVSITLLVNGIKSITGNTAAIIMKTPTSWAANLKVM